MPNTALLPPSHRDFDIHRAHVIEHQSTRTLAEKHGLSQTRIRQLVHSVNNWLAATLPVKTELERDQETRLAQHLAAEQLQHQIEQLQAFWNGSSDPSYLRQQTRVILALARLGIVPGTIDSLAANREGEAPAEPGCVAERSAVNDSNSLSPTPSVSPTL